MQDLFAGYYKAAEKKAKQMTVREKGGRSSFFSLPGFGTARGA